LTDLVVLSDFSNECTESLVDIDSLLGRRLDKFAAKVLGEITPLYIGVIKSVSACGDINHQNRIQTIHPNLSFILQIALVGNDDNRESILILDPKDLLVERADFLKRVARRDRVDEEEAFTSTHVLFTHSSVNKRLVYFYASEWKKNARMACRRGFLKLNSKAHPYSS